MEASIYLSHLAGGRESGDLYKREVESLSADGAFLASQSGTSR
jgi:hypothetical protein